MTISRFKVELRPLLTLVLPLVLTGIAQSAPFFIETAFLARLGENILAAGALASWLYGILIVIAFGTMSSINILVAHKHGAGDQTGISYVFRDGFILAFLISIPSVILLWNIAPVFLLFGQSAEIVTLATAYLHPLAWGVTANILLIVFLELLIGIAQARETLIFNLLAVVFNIIASYLLIFGKFGFPKLGIAGAGWGTSIGNFLAVIILAAFVFGRKIYRGYCKNLFSLQGKSYVGELVRVGIPMGIMYCFEVAYFLALTLMMGTISPLWMAANQIVMQYMGSLTGVVFSIAQAITVRMSHLLGERNMKAARTVGYLGGIIALGYILVINLFYLFTPEWLIAVDLDVSAAANQRLIVYIKSLFIGAAFFQVFEAIRIALFGALRAYKDTRFTLYASVLSFWGIALPLGYGGLHYFHYSGVWLWWSMGIGVLVSVVLLAWRFKVISASHNYDYVE
ncbi:MATE family efflux transporter [Legionella dresdenensis]|uniref:Multidrug-efflux transporter n=1 Tax=Legionella dresdenensis TaxID=450200 RepID=A0ABV8CCX2_9GAMM